jgi:putative PIN family toxin of toxin-antitoxin system
MTLRVVLDTNIVLSALLFSDGRLAWIREAWQAGRIRPVVCRQTISELLRTLAYPKFRLTKTEQEELLADFLPYAETVVLEKTFSRLPKCRDKDDQMFVTLASVSGVGALISGDTDLFALRSELPFPVLSAGELKNRLGPD